VDVFGRDTSKASATDERFDSTLGRGFRSCDRYGHDG